MAFGWCFASSDGNGVLMDSTDLVHVLHVFDSRGYSATQVSFTLLQTEDIERRVGRVFENDNGKNNGGSNRHWPETRHIIVISIGIAALPGRVVHNK